mgnify:CR=1 FL=1|jgi:hypothetical protein
MSHKHIIAIAGNARSGKDTLAKNISSLLNGYGIKSSILSFANELKRETDSFLKETLGISAFTEDDIEKSIIRPFLVFWGTDVRRQINPNIWVENLSVRMLENEVTIIPDLRFENELTFIRDKGGSIIYLSRIDENQELVPAANSYELENNKVIAAEADSQFTWFSTNDESTIKSMSNEALETILTMEKFEKWKAISLS